ncbi:hypothetical protein I6A60_07220 [Frankia sp. AgB1.9]|uniref:hypothetical protein n=1 Tax=unclassified Frankia TaxID=2632575 RepID=UPI001933BB1F|nr:MULTISPECIES: hypothetical protein [unclassified Frankia]MBL7488388.1 hypothetical protein [Frankia sp. AgW1.1]MBL7547664.1 hypothetical protein [Frankia sp. AgB1.9]MBL7624091.1 hypothetical protein [Frankia sp. AgB1.8]
MNDELKWLRLQLQREATGDPRLIQVAQSLARITAEVLDLLDEAADLAHYAGDDVVAAVEEVRKQAKSVLRATALIVAWFDQ